MTLRGLLFALVAVASPAFAAVTEPDGYRMDHYRAPVPESVHGATVVHTAALPGLIAQRHPVLIDVLPAPEPPADARPGLPRMPVPHKDIPGSIWLADVGRGAIAPQKDAWFRSELEHATHGDRTAPVLFYCLSNCWMSWNATKRAVGYGYTNAFWYPEGADGWEAAGNPTETASPRK
jgi:PQQ-dependent catabolism-associated CXXCW motif protein